MKSNRIERPTRYKSAIIAPAAGGYDLINPATGRWTHYRTQRAAKWWASVWSTVSESFETSTVREVPTINEEN